NRRLAQAGGKGFWRDEFERDAFRRRIQHVERLDLGLPSPALEEIAHKLCVGPVVRRTDVIGLGRELLQPSPDLRGIELAVEAALESRLRNRARTREAVHGRSSGFRGSRG